MSATHQLSRRTALSGFGLGSLGLLASYAAGAAASGRETGLTNHPLTGLWLAHISLPADADATAAVPAFFGADGSAVVIYPCVEAVEDGAQLRGMAIGTWAPIDEHEARFTAVQTCFGADGTYHGTRTYDGYPVVSDDGMSFTVKGEFDLLTVRDASNAITESRAGATGSAMHGIRMSPGDAGFRMAGGTEAMPGT